MYEQSIVPCVLACDCFPNQIYPITPRSRRMRRGQFEMESIRQLRASGVKTNADVAVDEVPVAADIMRY